MSIFEYDKIRIRANSPAHTVRLCDAKSLGDSIKVVRVQLRRMTVGIRGDPAPSLSTKIVADLQ